MRFLLRKSRTQTGGEYQYVHGFHCLCAQNKDLEADLTATRLQLENSEREISRLKRLFAPKKKFNVRLLRFLSRPRYLARGSTAHAWTRAGARDAICSTIQHA